MRISNIHMLKNKLNNIIGYNIELIDDPIVHKLKDLLYEQEKTIDELMTIKGIGKTKAITILSALELGKRVLENKRDKIQITCPEIVFDLLNYDLKDLKQEVLIALYLDLKTNLIAYLLIC